MSSAPEMLLIVFHYSAQSLVVNIPGPKVRCEICLPIVASLINLRLCRYIGSTLLSPVVAMHETKIASWCSFFVDSRWRFVGPTILNQCSHDPFILLSRGGQTAILESNVKFKQSYPPSPQSVLIHEFMARQPHFWKP